MGWKEIKEYNMPEKTGRYLVCWKSRLSGTMWIQIDVYNVKKQKWNASNDVPEGYAWWQPLPEYPEEQ